MNLRVSQGSDPETIDTGAINSRYDAILQNKTLNLGGVCRIKYDMDRVSCVRFGAHVVFSLRVFFRTCYGGGTKCSLLTLMACGSLPLAKMETYLQLTSISGEHFYKL